MEFEFKIILFTSKFLNRLCTIMNILKICRQRVKKTTYIVLMSNAWSFTSSPLTRRHVVIRTQLKTFHIYVCVKRVSVK